MDKPRTQPNPSYEQATQHNDAISDGEYETIKFMTLLFEYCIVIFEVVMCILFMVFLLLINLCRSRSTCSLHLYIHFNSEGDCSVVAGDVRGLVNDYNTRLCYRHSLESTLQS